MTDDAKQAWAVVGERFGAVGKRLADRYKEGGADEEAAKEAEHKLERAVDAVDGTVRDSESRTDLKEALNALGDAITATAKDVESAGRRDGDGKSDPPRPDDET
jgi:hypothetical protein